MARFAEWIPKWLGFDNLIVANLLAFVAAMALMIVLAWAIERLCLSKLVNQEGITLLMATLGISYFLDGLGQTMFGNDIYSINVGMPKDPAMILENMFEGGLLLSKEDLIAAIIAAALVALLALFFQKTATGRAARGGRRPPGGAVDRHPAEPHRSSCGRWPVSPRWWPASSGAPSWACSSRCRWWR